MSTLRKSPPSAAELHGSHNTERCCEACGNSVHQGGYTADYGNLCMSCYFDFHEDDIILELFAPMMQRRPHAPR